MTARVTTLKGPEAGAYYVEHLPSYYLGAGEPPGRWHGRGAVLSGLAGEVDPEEFTNIVSGFDPTGTWLLGRRFGDDGVRAFDVTCSAPKSVSVLWAVAKPPVREQVLAAHEAAVAAVIEVIDSQAVTRRTKGGETVVVDARGVMAAVFRQHTSRAGDPQLHSHVVVSSKVQDASGRWLALDARALKFDQRTWSAIYHSALRSELTSRLGVRWLPPVNGIAEMATVDPEVLAAFSTRTEQYERRLQVKLARFAETMGRAPTPREEWRLQREAAVDSRPRKEQAVRTPADLHARWRTQLLAHDVNPAELTAAAVGRPKIGILERPGIGAMVDQALAALAEDSSTWRRNDLLRELARAIPPTVTIAAEGLPSWLGVLADHVISERLIELAPVPPPGTPRRADGRPVTESTLDRRFTIQPILDQEEAIDASVHRRIAAGGGPGDVEAGQLDRAQLGVARAVAGTAQLVLVVGPAGSGKTTALRPAVTALGRHGRKVIGLAPSATAAAVLQAETGLQHADTVDAWLLRMRQVRPGRGGTTVLVDEASMLSTAKLHELLQTADRHACRVVLVGDPMQLSAVGRGGMFAHLVSTLPAVELEHVHRFTEAWEARASLALRAGHPDALHTYDAHDRIHAGTSDHLEQEVLERWRELRKRGSVAVLAGTNGTVARLNARMQQHRADAGELGGTSRQLPNGQTLHLGDDVATRHNDRHLRTDRGETIRNRARWIVEAIDDDGSVTVAGRDGRATLPPAYVAEHLELAYAETIHAAQGRTVDHSLLLIDGPLNGAAIYVGLTRGRRANHVYVTTEPGQEPLEVLEEALQRSWADRPAIEIRAELEANAQALRQAQSSGRLGL